MPAVSIESHFESLTDPRRKESTCPLINIVTMALCAVVCGTDDGFAIAAWTNGMKKAWLAGFLDMSAGVPAHDRFHTSFRALKPDEFERCLLYWVTALHEVPDGQVIAIDGKTLRRSYDNATGKSAIPMVSAWAKGNHLSPGQTTTQGQCDRRPADRRSRSAQTGPACGAAAADGGRPGGVGVAPG